ncbi:MAG: 30S ribosomal protein S3 [Candidatus Wildermuthbacteria bacterium]|nr:30S ribosomal protein S3 [Candidatus Wildermuthbacteria bacterium]
MAHKVHPKSFRIKETKDWSSRWLSKRNFPQVLEEDFQIREFLEKKLKEASVDKIDIERSPGKLSLIIETARPGLIIGRGGAGIEELKRQLKTIVKSVKDFHLDIREIRNPWEYASLVASWIVSQLEKRMAPRKVMKQAVSKTMANRAIKGVRVEIAGRLGGAEIARREWLAQGRLPRQTLRANVDYALKEALTRYGTIGVKVWLYKGDIFE